MAVFPSLCAPQKDQSCSEADRSPKSGDQEDDGRPGHPQGAGDPEAADGGPVQASAVALYDVTGRGSRVGYTWPSLFGCYVSPAFRCPRVTLGASLTSIVRWTQWSSSARSHCAFQKVV